jgi:hypothetical protein
VIIPEQTVGEVVAEASAKMADPSYSAVVVGGFVQQQAATAHYLSAHANDVGGAEAVVTMIFHAALISACFQRGNNRSVRAMSFDDLDAVAHGDRAARLGAQQPHILAYIRANVDHPQMSDLLILVALAMEWVS